MAGSAARVAEGAGRARTCAPPSRGTPARACPASRAAPRAGGCGSYHGGVQPNGGPFCRPPDAASWPRLLFYLKSGARDLCRCCSRPIRHKAVRMQQEAMRRFKRDAYIGFIHWVMHATNNA